MLLSCHSFETIPGIWRCLWTPSIKNPILNDHMKMRCDNYYKKTSQLNSLHTAHNYKERQKTHHFIWIRNHIMLFIATLGSCSSTGFTWNDIPVPSFAVLAWQIATFVKGMASKDMGYGDHLHLEDFCTMWSTETCLAYFSTSNCDFFNQSNTCK